ncbi:MAG: hypothetical protein IKG04_06500, partial [Exiguobacterium sp.]|nr:hypothetical protein [Exiguobacterium sp.]
GLASLFEQGDISVTAGMSGIELAYETLERSGLAPLKRVLLHRNLKRLKRSPRESAIIRSSRAKCSM